LVRRNWLGYVGSVTLVRQRWFDDVGSAMLAQLRWSIVAGLSLYAVCGTGRDHSAYKDMRIMTCVQRQAEHNMCYTSISCRPQIDDVCVDMTALMHACPSHVSTKAILPTLYTG